MNIITDILSVFNAISLITVIIGLLISLVSFIEIIKIMYDVGIKGYGLPKIAFYGFLSILFMAIAFIFMVLLLLKWLDSQGLALFFIMLSMIFNYYAVRVLKNVLNELLYA